jgi:hypothetical protein
MAMQLGRGEDETKGGREGGRLEKERNKWKQKCRKGEVNKEKVERDDMKNKERNGENIRKIR